MVSKCFQCINSLLCSLESTYYMVYSVSWLIFYWLCILRIQENYSILMVSSILYWNINEYIKLLCVVYALIILGL